MHSNQRPKKMTLKEMVAAEPRCIYCPSPPVSLEHMPPIWAFSKRQRPKGLEFATCFACNNGTRAADLAAGWIARITMRGDAALHQEAVAKIASIDQLAPGLREEVFDNSFSQLVNLKADGKVTEMVRIEASGPILAGLLTTFAAKLGMALYREHVGQALPDDGAVFVQPYLNGGLSQKQADAILSILPVTNTLRQGRRNVSDQFAYAYNSDGRSIVMALASFHRNLHFSVLATAEPDIYEATVRGHFASKIKSGELLKPRVLPSITNRTAVPPRPRVLPGLPEPRGG